VKHADAVVAAEIRNYLIVTPGTRIVGGGRFAQFDLQVKENLKGEVPQSLTIYLDDYPGGLPDVLEPGRYMIALLNPGSRSTDPV